MYTVRHLASQAEMEARGLSLDEAFARLMALSERQYRFVRTGWQMHLLMTSPPPEAPDFVSWASSNVTARREIKEAVCRHGLGQFVVTSEGPKGCLQSVDRIAAE